MIARIKAIIKKLVYKIVPPPIVPATYSFAQAGEDSILDFLFGNRGIRKPSYLELGVCSADRVNNTYKFYLRGSYGVLVEADESLISTIRKVRPNDIILGIGVGVRNEKSADFYVFSEPSLNTFNKEEAEYRERVGSFKIERIKQVSLKSINEIISENFEKFPDLLSIDIEGLDLEVLKSLDFTNYPIPVICAETCTYSENHIKPKDHSIEKFMCSNGYEVYADTYINTIFVNSEWFYTLNR